MYIDEKYLFKFSNRLQKKLIFGLWQSNLIYDEFLDSSFYNNVEVFYTGVTGSVYVHIAHLCMWLWSFLGDHSICANISFWFVKVALFYDTFSHFKPTNLKKSVF